MHDASQSRQSIISAVQLAKPCQPAARKRNVCLQKVAVRNAEKDPHEEDAHPEEAAENSVARFRNAAASKTVWQADSIRPQLEKQATFARIAERVCEFSYTAPVDRLAGQGATGTRQPGARAGRRTQAALSAVIIARHRQAQLNGGSLSNAGVETCVCTVPRGWQWRL
jgi:hypothetical protein